MSGGGSKNVTSTTSPPDWAVNQVTGNINLANQIAGREYMPYTGERIAGPTLQQNRASELTQRLAEENPGLDDIRQAQGVASRVGSYQPQQVRAGSLNGRDLSGYTNPWENHVVQTSLADLNRFTSQQQLAANARAAVAGAFGGTRQAVMNGEVARGGIDAAARTSAGLRSQGFVRAQDLASQDLNREMQAQLANQSAGLQSAGLNLQASGQMAQNAAATQGYLLRNIGALQQSGGQHQALNQAHLDKGYADHLERQNYPLQQLAIRQGVLTGAPMGSTTTQPYFRNTGAAMMGGALGGAQLGGMFGGPAGAGIGAGLGLLSPFIR
ncbi:MAG TPA: hypothetical protein VEY95_06375 [Azospirillaceae bacterium]|nr:hypothetical protein [Azospirillaceae bacterium]